MTESPQVFHWVYIYKQNALFFFQVCDFQRQTVQLVTAQEKEWENDQNSFLAWKWTKSTMFFLTGLRSFSDNCHHRQTYMPIIGLNIEYKGKKQLNASQQKDVQIAKHGHYCQTVSHSRKVLKWGEHSRQSFQGMASFLSKMTHLCASDLQCAVLWS